MAPSQDGWNLDVEIGVNPSHPQLKVYVAAVVAVAVALLATASWAQPPVESQAFTSTLAALLLLGFLSEASSISLRLGSATSSVAFVPFLATVFLLGPSWAMLVGGLSFFAVEAFVRRKPPIKILFNAGKEVIALAGAGHIYVYLGGGVSISRFEFAPLPIFSAILVYLVIGHTAVCVAISLAERISFADVWSRIAGTSILHDLFSSLLAPLLAWLWIKADWVGLAALTSALFFVRHFYRMFRDLERVNHELLELMVKSIEARDPYTSGHSQRVAKFARLIARGIGLSPKQVEHIATAALLHDVGKIYEEFAPILRKEGPLTAEERQIMQSHPVRSAELIATVSDLRGPVEQAVRHHHENFDGSGYPDGLAGEEIPIGARVIMIADTLDAMTTDRPYRRALSFEKVIEELIRHSNTQFDPRLVQSVVHSRAIRVILSERSSDPRHAPSPPITSLVARRRSARARRFTAGDRP